MVFEELVTEVCERLNYTSDEAKSRVGRELNSRYRRVTSSIGLETSRRTTVSTQATIGNRNLTFSNIEKVISVIDKTDPNAEAVLTQVTMDEMHDLPIRTQPPRYYAVLNMHSTSVAVYLDCTPTQAAVSATVSAGGTGYAVNNILTLSGGTSTITAQFKVTAVSGGVVTAVSLYTAGTYTALPSSPSATTSSSSGTGCTLTVTWSALFTLYADGHANVSTLSGNQSPDFPESFHDILIFGVMADEYKKLEKVQLAQLSESDYERRLSDLRMWIAKSAYLDITQGKQSKSYPWLTGADTRWW